MTERCKVLSVWKHGEHSGDNMWGPCWGPNIENLGAYPNKNEKEAIITKILQDAFKHI